MKKSTILLFILFISSGSLFSQVTKDSTKLNSVEPKFYDRMSPEESWEIHRAAYIKQLKSNKLRTNEIEVKIANYDKQKREFLKNILEQRKLAAIRRLEAEKLREQAEEQRNEAAIQRKEAEKLREQSNILKKQAEENRNQSTLQREEAAELREQAAKQRENASKLRDEAKIQRENAAVLREEAAKQRELVKEWKNSFEVIFTEEVEILKSTNKKPIVIKIEKQNALLFNIVGRISSGNVLIEIFNPNGDKKGELSLEYVQKSNLTGGNELLKTTAASLNKTIPNAEAGDWQIKISTQKAEGNISISVAQYLKSSNNE